MTWSEQQLTEYLARVPGAAQTSAGQGVLQVDGKRVGGAPTMFVRRTEAPIQAGRRALGRLPTGEMNKTEAAYAAHLEYLRRDGVILWFKFEAIKLRLADLTFYTPDFAVMTASCALEMHEVKGFWEDDARVKIKVAAEMYPFRFLAAKPKSRKNGGGYEVEVFE